MKGNTSEETRRKREYSCSHKRRNKLAKADDRVSGIRVKASVGIGC
jgi:hypothetical protein